MTDCMYPDICYLFASYHASCKRNTHQTAMNIGTLEYEPIKLEEKSSEIRGGSSTCEAEGAPASGKVAGLSKGQGGGKKMQLGSRGEQ